MSSGESKAMARGEEESKRTGVGINMKEEGSPDQERVYLGSSGDRGDPPVQEWHVVAGPDHFRASLSKRPRQKEHLF